MLVGAKLCFAMERSVKGGFAGNGVPKLEFGNEDKSEGDCFSVKTGFYRVKGRFTGPR